MITTDSTPVMQMQYSMRNMSGRSDNLAILATATKDDLICANNYAYISLNNEKLILLARLEAQQYDSVNLYAYMRLISVDRLLMTFMTSFPVVKHSPSQLSMLRPTSLHQPHL